MPHLIWETDSLREVTKFRGFLLGAHSVAFSPEMNRLAVGSSGQEAVKLWDIESMQELLTLPGQGMMFGRSAFSPDGNLLGSLTSYGGALHLWRAPSWEEIATAEAKEKTESSQP